MIKKVNLIYMIVVSIILIFSLSFVGCGNGDGDGNSGGSSGSDSGTGTVVVKNSSGTVISNIQITGNGKTLASRGQNLANGSSATFSNIAATRINVRVDTGSSANFDTRNKSVDLKKGQKLTLTRKSRSLE